MAEYIVQGESLSAVADKIREKTDSSASLAFPDGFVDAIDGLIDPTVDVGSVTIPDVAITAAPTINITSGGLIMAEVNGSGTITPSVTPGYVSSVEGADAVVTGYSSSQLPTQAAQTITPTTVDQTIPAGKFLTGAQTIKGDANLTQAHIADGVTIFGVQGTYQGEPGSVTIPDVAITAAPTINITSGGLITAEVNGSGTITPSVTPGYVSSVEGADAVVTGYSSSQLPTQAAQTITPTTVDQTIPAGKFLTGVQTIKGDANLIPANIADGVTIFGVLGTHQGGAQPQLNAPTISVAASGNQSVINITNPASNGSFVEKYKIYLNGVYYTETTQTLLIPIPMIGQHSVTVKACGTNFEDSAASNAVTVNNYTITVTCVDCTADVGNPTVISNNGATATLVFAPDTDLEIRSDSVVISGASVVSVDKATGTVVIGSATANVVMTVTALEIPSAAILTVSGLGNEDPTSVVFSESGSPFDWNFQEVTIDGNIFIKIPTMYRKVNTVVDNQITSFSLSDTKVDNSYYPYPCFLDSDGTTVLPYVLIGKYCSSSTSVMNSVNATPATQRVGNARANAQILGTGYQLYDWQIQKLLVDLFMMKAKTVNFQSGSGIISDYLGIYHLNLGIWVDGIFHNDTTWYAALDPSDYVSSPSTYPPVGYSALSYGVLTDSSYEIKALGYDSNNPFINYPLDVTDNSNYDTYYCDQCIYSAGSHPCNATVGDNAPRRGLWFIQAALEWSYLSNVRLCYKPISA